VRRPARTFAVILLGVAALSGCQSPVKASLLRGRLLLPDGAVDGELLIGADGKIACAEASCAGRASYASAQVLELGEVVISPGLINAHDHTGYNTTGPQAHADIRYLHRHDWRLGLEGFTQLPLVNPTSDRATLVASELRSVLGGATAVISSDGPPGLLRDLTMPGTELQGLSGRDATYDTFPLGDGQGPLVESGCDYPKLTTKEKAFAAGAYATHIGEGINAAAHNELGCLSALVSERTAIIHAMAVGAREAESIRASGATVIWSPRSSLGLYGDTTPVTLYRALGVPIALGTDWLASGSLNVLREMSCAERFNRTALAGTFSDQELWSMVTANAARAAGFERELGALREGFAADVTVFRGSGDYRAVVGASVEDVALVLRGGHPLAGEPALVSPLQKDCPTLEVCGRTIAVCLDLTGVSLDQVKAAAARVSPLFACRGAPPGDEPSCVPYRAEYPAGVTLTDRDGDGVTDLADVCPAIFNPARPMDGASQADADQDGFGDVCDAAPLDASRH
jgi:hypothetical protein